MEWAGLLAEKANSFDTNSYLVIKLRFNESTFYLSQNGNVVIWLNLEICTSIQCLFSVLVKRQ